MLFLKSVNPPGCFFYTAGSLTLENEEACIQKCFSRGEERAGSWTDTEVSSVAESNSDDYRQCGSELLFAQTGQRFYRIIPFLILERFRLVHCLAVFTKAVI